MEKEILDMLDHPFLPTLYAKFDASHYSCLVMEFCPGSDLYVARQCLPRKCFSISSASGILRRSPSRHIRCFI
ncbi:hypothetical protein ACFX1X_023446 [Malus domestica]